MGAQQTTGKVRRARRMSMEELITNKNSVTTASTLSSRTPITHKGLHKRTKSQDPFRSTFTFGNNHGFCNKGRNSDPGPDKPKLELPKISTCIVMIPKTTKNVIAEDLAEYDQEDEEVFQELMNTNN
ncbi:unnamed protein product [Moneuplotes crassus]|uniref:Uncharacterized protein n=1 Tax=Euplotes crassus TaxID=5936 RepID=A0AAD1UF93_EUPCR|nr:unnamed protein product [Moneuplotes crassus]CAI2365774.1 unnamed protein product [Moneuplotes crassus]